MSEQAKPEITPGPWELCVLDMPLADVPEYVRKCIDASGGADYHFVRAKNADGEWVDVCHVGNGPMGNFNGHYIAQLPALLDEITALRAAHEALLRRTQSLETALDQERAEAEKLKLYAEHHIRCRYEVWSDQSRVCTCGLSALLSGRGEGG